MNPRYKLSKMEQDALQAFKIRLKDIFGGNLLEIKLFGSRARKDAHEESDIDILLIFKERGGEVEEKLVDILCETLNETGVYFEVVSYSRDEYKEARRRQWPFIINVEREAIPV